MTETAWAGIEYIVVGRHDVERLRTAGLFAFVSRDGDRGVLLFVGEAQDIARAAGPHHPAWAQALGLGFNELCVCLSGGERLDRLQLLARIVRAEAPALNSDGPAQERSVG